MQIQVNGDSLQVDSGMTLSQLITQLDLGDKRIAVELNLEIIPRSQHVETFLSEADRIEIVHAIGGG